MRRLVKKYINMFRKQTIFFFIYVSLDLLFENNIIIIVYLHDVRSPPRVPIFRYGISSYNN